MPAIPTRRSAAWWSYSVFLAAVALVGVAYFLHVGSRSFWELTWAMVPWQACSTAALALVLVRRRGKLWWGAFVLSNISVTVWTVLALLEWSPDSSPWQELFYNVA